ncbi:MAG: hypothetical protein AAF236_10525 [Verrucomicrobiota bacterium]
MTRIILSTLLFTVVALLSFSVWAFFSQSFGSEAALYAGCAIVFLGLGGFCFTPILKTLKGVSVLNFYWRFTLGFVIYAVSWSFAWFTFRNTFGEVLGTFVGLVALVAMTRPSLKRGLRFWESIAIVFLWMTLGYYLGEYLYQALQGRGSLPLDFELSREAKVLAARLGWGLGYGLGLGAGVSHWLHASRHP